MDYNILAVILLLIIVGLMTKMSQNQENFETISRLERGRKICDSQSFKPWSLTFPDDTEVKNIVNTVLQHINQKLDMNYHLGNLDHVTKETDFEGNTRYLIDFFSIHLDPEKVNDANRRFILDVTKKGKKIKVNLLTVGNAKKYKHPHEMNLPSLEDNELILKDTNYNNVYHIMGQVYPNLDYGESQTKVDIKHLSDVKHKYQRWILPKEATKCRTTFPCRKQQKWWDINGVHDTDKKSKSCNGINTATVPRPITAEFQASHGKLLSEPNDYTWLFDKARGSQSSTSPLSGPTPIQYYHK